MSRNYTYKPTHFYPALSILIAGGLLSGCGWFKPKVPVVVAYRDSLLDESKVVRITNASNETLYQFEVTVDGKNYFKDKVSPDETVEIGWLQLDNYKPTATDEVTITAMNYRAFGPVKIEACKKTEL